MDGPLDGGQPLDDPVAESAIAWMVEMMSGEITEAQMRSFEAWLDSNPAHERAWTLLQGGLVPCGVAARQPMLRGLLVDRLRRRKRTRRNILAGVIGAIGLGAAGLAVGNRFLPLDEVLADRVTLTAQHKRVQLADGSSLLMAPRSALDIGSGTLRNAFLREGRVMAEIAAQPRAFTFAAAGLSLQAQQGRFLLQRVGQRISATVIEGVAVLFTKDQGGMALEAGRKLVIDKGKPVVREADLEAATAWTRNILIAKDKTVSCILGNLRPYFPGVIRCAPEVATLRVTGIFLLNEPRRAVEALSASLDLSVAGLGDYYLSIGPGRG